MKTQRKHKCKNCKEYFDPDRRVVKRQKFCSKPACRIASKRESQRRWLKQPDNRDYFRGSTNVQRVQEWRKAHPGYWRRTRAKSENALQDQSPTQPTDFKGETKHLNESALQDLILSQPAELIGLFSALIRYRLQDEIAAFIVRFHTKGKGIDILRPSTKGEDNAVASNYQTRAAELPPTFCSGANRRTICTISCF